MKVLSFSYCFPNSTKPQWGIFVLQRLGALAKLDEVEVVSPVPIFRPVRGRGPLPASETLAGLKVHRPGFLCVPGLFKSCDAWLYARALRPWLRDYCRTNRPDLLDAHFIWPDGVAVAMLAAEMNLPFVITLRGKIFECTAGSMNRQCRAALHTAAAVISVSKQMADLAIEWGHPASSMHLIPNGVDTNLFHPRDRIACRRRLGLPTQQPMIVAVAHLKPSKGVGELVEAVSRLHPRPHLVLVGGEAERGYRRTLQQQIARLGVSEHVSLVGAQSYENIPLFLSAADVCVLASHREGCPNVVLESLSSGTPVVASDVGAVRDILRHGEDGLIYPAGNVGRLVVSIKTALQRSWSQAVLHAAPGVVHWRRVAIDVHKVLEHACSKPTPAGMPKEAT